MTSVGTRLKALLRIAHRKRSFRSDDSLSSIQVYLYGGHLAPPFGKMMKHIEQLFATVVTCCNPGGSSASLCIDMYITLQSFSTCTQSVY